MNEWLFGMRAKKGTFTTVIVTPGIEQGEAAQTLATAWALAKQMMVKNEPRYKKDGEKERGKRRKGQPLHTVSINVIRHFYFFRCRFFLGENI